MNEPVLRSIATAVPDDSLGRDRWLAAADQMSPPEVDRKVLARLAERSGIDARGCSATTEGPDAFYRTHADPDPGTGARMALWSRAARAMAERAARRALEESGVAPGDVTHVITASCTGFESPGVDAHLIESLSLPRTVRRVNVGFMGCHAAVNALSVARDAVRSRPGAAALVCCAEVSTAHFHRSARLDHLVANTLFADGAAAMVVAEGDGPRVAGTHSALIPGTAHEMAWTVGDHGFSMTLGAGVPDVLLRTVGPWVDGALAEHGLLRESVGGWAVHPGGPRVLDAVGESLGLPAEALHASRSVLREHGNMSSATLPFILKRLADAGTPRPWVGLAFGPGLVGEMVLVT